MNTYLSIILTIAGGAYVLAQWRNGKNTAAKGTIDLLQSRATAFEKALQEEKEENKRNHLESQTANAKNAEEIIRLQEQLKHSKEENAKLLDILRGRDPAALEFMKLLTGTANLSLEYMNTTSQNLKDINAFMERIELKLSTIK